MTSVKIVLDSSADLTAMEGVPFAFAPLKVITKETQYIDDASLDVEAMAEALYNYRGPSSTSCPNVEDWLKAFGNAKEILCITITGGLSGAYNAALAAKRHYEEANPGSRVEVMDSLSAGPEITIMAEKAKELLLSGKTLSETVEALKNYKTELFFMLESLQNFANNGRVGKLAAKTAGVLGIRALGRAGDEGTLELLGKVRGKEKALQALADTIQKWGYKGGKLRIAHCGNPDGAEALSKLILRHFPKATVTISTLRGLCSYYAERGGMLVGCEV